MITDLLTYKSSMKKDPTGIKKKLTSQRAIQTKANLSVEATSLDY